jgi:hypothetical protein
MACPFSVCQRATPTRMSTFTTSQWRAYSARSSEQRGRCEGFGGPATNRHQTGGSMHSEPSHSRKGTS